MANKDTIVQPQEGVPAFAELSEFDSLLQKEFRPKTDQAKQAVQIAVRTLAEQALIGALSIPDDAIKTIESLIAELDRKLTEQVNLIMHHQDYQQLEGSWRGLHHLVANTETDETLKIRVINISKKELGRTLKKFKGTAWDQSPLFKKVYEDEYGTPGGAPYGCLVGDYFFDHTAPDVDILSGMAQIAAAAHTPFLSAASPTVMGFDSWQQLGDPRDLTKKFQMAEYAPWNSLRASDDARYLGLAMPRYLSRLPYGAKTSPVDEFAFEEDVAGADHGKYCWGNAAYLMATNITRSFKMYGWCARIRGMESGGRADGLPCHTFPTDDGGVDMKCPTEVAITDRREAELAKNGFMPVSHYKNTDYAVFMGAQSLQKPQEFEDKDATANANLSARWPYLFAVCRFAHFLKCMVRDKVGAFKDRAEMQTWLNGWVNQYCVDSASSSETQKAERPLASAEVVVEDIEGNPGFYSAKFFLKPHYQLEGLTVSLRLVSKLPTAKGGQ
jgi:type VI secretion system protein ImpC